MIRVFSYFVIISLLFSGIFIFPLLLLASSVYPVTSVSDFSSGVSASTTISDIGNGDGDVANTLGSETLDQSQTTGNTQRSFDNVSWLAQTFTAGQSGFLTKINVRLDRNNSVNTNGDITLELRNTVSGAPDSTVLASTSTLASSVNKNGATDYDFVFSSQPAVTFGAVYALVVYRSGSGTTTADFNWYSDAAGRDIYANGGRYTSTSGASWALQNSGKGDLRFQTYYQAYPLSGTSASDVLDANSSATVFGPLSWSETLLSGMDIIFEVRASSSVFLKTDASPVWVSLGSADSPINLNSALPSAYQYFQWRATLSGSATNTPTLHDVSVTYNRPPVLNAIGNKSVDENQNLSFILSASDLDNDPLTYSASNLPAGSTFDANTRTFTWTPSYSQSGNYPSVHFEATDGTAIASEDIAIAVNNVNRAPILDTIGNKSVNENNSLNFIISASDPDNDSIIYSASNLPTVAVFDANTKTFTWTPDFSQSGNYSITFKASDGSLEDSEAVAVDVGDVRQDDGGVFVSSGGGGSAGAPFGEFSLAPVTSVPAVVSALPVLTEQAPAQNAIPSVPVIPAISETRASQVAVNQSEADGIADDVNLTAQLTSQVDNPVVENPPSKPETAERKSLLASFIEFLKIKEIINFVSSFF